MGRTTTLTMVAMIMMRTLHRDITKYNQLETSDDAQEETGWKLVRVAPRAGTSAGPRMARVRQPQRLRIASFEGQQRFVAD